MKTLACVTVALGMFGAIAAVNPAAAATGQCFDAYGRPVGPPHDTDNPPYGLICSVYRQGGQCTHVQYSWAVGNCGLAPRHQGYREHYDYAPRPSYRRGPPNYYNAPNFGYPPSPAPRNDAR